ncbi:hypothetical protein BJ878DRAFT_567378 [Calycina marina]|uniref:ABC transporter domain-containing protein n=1 Tax=Calycina marina TaxID=1763456 RepID=A0A9P7Z3V1_9HELO|nr:hypothetical protein BJ878DRAFT_567378 [Calycina marina]
MSICPQDDAVDNLTVHQTLRLYTKVKGLNNIYGNVEAMTALNITQYSEKLVKALIGDTKRKMSLIHTDDPLILLLDEPPTGQDVGAKCVLWKTLQDIGTNRVILLTTHFMEEAEAIAANVAMMGTCLLAKGTLYSFQEAYSILYSVLAVHLPGTTAAQVEAMIKIHFPEEASPYEGSDRQGDVIWDNESESGGGGGASTEVGRVLGDYSINGPTLEEVFMKFARDTGASDV